jgi:hypothetical protein
MDESWCLLSLQLSPKPSGPLLKLPTRCVLRLMVHACCVYVTPFGLDNMVGMCDSPDDMVGMCDSLSCLDHMNSLLTLDCACHT